MKGISRLLQKARQYHEGAGGRRLAIVCRNYDERGEWLCRITRTVKGNPYYDEDFFREQEDAISWAQEHTSEADPVIIDNI